MTAPRDPDALIAAYLAEGVDELPEWELDAVRRDIHRTRQRNAIGGLDLPDTFRLARFAVGVAAVMTIGIVLLNLQPLLGPTGGPSPTPSAAVAPSPTTGASERGSAAPNVFTSPIYGYTVTVPGGWIVGPAVLRWDGVNSPGPDAEVDKFGGPGSLSVSAYAGPVRGDLAAFVADRIAANERDHSNTCPVATPEVNEPIDIGGQPGVFLAWNCGAVINNAVTVRGGVGYVFTLRDLSIRAATDPTDLALFRSIVGSVKFPNEPSPRPT